MNTVQIGQEGLTSFLESLSSRVAAVEQSGGENSGKTCAVCTKAEYDALTSYDDNTIYFIRG